jgi:hypothetical protein
MTFLKPKVSSDKRTSLLQAERKFTSIPYPMASVGILEGCKKNTSGKSGYSEFTTSPNLHNPFHDEFLSGSGIHPDLFAESIEFVEDSGFWEVHQRLNLPVATQWIHHKPHNFGNTAFFKNEDGTDWQAKPETPITAQNGKAQKYQAPKGNGSTAYLPPLDLTTRQTIAQRYGCDVPPPGESFWAWLESHPELPIVLTEGGKKGLSLLSHGTITIALYGINGGYRVKDPTTGLELLKPEIIATLARFTVPGRPITLAFDQDSAAATREKVDRALCKFSTILEKAGCTVTIAQWDRHDGKGVDDLIVSAGISAWETAQTEAIPAAQYRIQQQLSQRVKRTPDRNIGDREFKEIAHELPTSGIVVLLGAKGTGKSEAIGIMKGDRPWISITHRRSIGRDQAAGWDGIFLQDGDRFGSQALKPDGTPASGAAVCFPSLLSAERLSRDVGIFDETTAGLEFLLGSKLCNKDGIRPLLIAETEKTIREPQLLILADADMSEEAIAYFEAIRGERAYVVKSERKPLGYAVYNMAGKKNQAIGEFLHQAGEIPDGKMVYLNSDSKTLVNALEVVLTARGIKTLSITQDNSGEDLQRALTEGKGRNLPELAMMGIKVILSSPSITQGFSLTQNTDRIISRWGIYTGGSISAQDIAQAPDRIRSDAPLYLWVAERGSAYSRLGRATNQKQFLKDFESISTTSARLVRQSLSATTAAAIDVIDYQNRNLSMLASIEVSRNLGMVALRETVLAHLRLEGKQIQDHSPAIDIAAAKESGKVIAAAGSKLKADHAAAVEAAADRAEDEIKTLEKKAEKQALSLEERLSVEKYYLSLFYRLETVKALDVMLDRNGRTRQQVRNLERVLDAAKAVQHTAESIDRNASTPQDWSKAALQAQIVEESGTGDLIRRLFNGEITQLTPDLIEPIYQFSQNYPAYFEKGFGWGGAKKLSPMKVIGILLDWAGIERQSHRHRSEGKITRVYTVKADRLEWLKSLVERRSKADPHVDNRGVNPTCGSAQNTPVDLTEWADFIKYERQKSHTPDSLRLLRGDLNYIPSQVWEAIAV